MNKNQVQSLIRGGLKALGGALAAHGITSQSASAQLTQLASGIISFAVAQLWSHYFHADGEPKQGNGSKLPMLIFCVAALVLMPAASCNQARLQSGGAYAPLSSMGSPTQAPDLAFYQVDLAGDLVFSTLDAGFKFEYDNRALLLQISPQIKANLDKVRPQAQAITIEWAKARQAYMANPTPAGLTGLQDILARLKPVAAAVQTALPAGTTLK